MWKKKHDEGEDKVWKKKWFIDIHIGDILDTWLVDVLCNMAAMLALAFHAVKWPAAYGRVNIFLNYTNKKTTTADVFQQQHPV